MTGIDLIATMQALVLVQIGILALCLLVQKSMARLYAAAIFVCGIICHDQAFYALSDDPFWYYLSAAAADLTVVLALSNLRIVPRLATDLSMVATASIVYNFIGWIMYVGGHDEITYLSLYIVLYSWAIIMLIRKEPTDAVAGDYAVGPWIAFFRFNVSRRDVLRSNQQAGK